MPPLFSLKKDEDFGRQVLREAAILTFFLIKACMVDTTILSRGKKNKHKNVNKASLRKPHHVFSWNGEEAYLRQGRVELSLERISVVDNILKSLLGQREALLRLPQRVQKTIPLI